MKHLIPILGAFLLLSPVLPLAQSRQSTPEAKRDDIRKLLEITKTRETGIRALDDAIEAGRRQLPQLKASAFDGVRRDCLAEIDSLIEGFVPVYDKYYTHEEIKAIIHFYETPAGRKVIETTPLVAQETAVVGAAWGQRLADIVRRKLTGKDPDQS